MQFIGSRQASSHCDSARTPFIGAGFLRKAGKISAVTPALLLLIAAWASHTLKAGQGETVIVIYNSSVKESKEVADYYSKRRQIPTNQVFGFDLPSAESMTRHDFQERMRKPLLGQLEKQRLVTHFLPSKGKNKTAQGSNHLAWAESKIRYAVLCFGVPLRIEEDSKLKEEGAEKLSAQLRKNEAAVDSELALLPVNESFLKYFGPFSNPGFLATNSAGLHPTNGVLLVARLDGPSPEIARGLIDKAIDAERDGLWGRAYFDARGLTNGSPKIGDDWIRGAAEVCRRSGFETVLDNKDERFSPGFPMSQIAFYAGWYEYDGQVSGPFTRPLVEFMPGAFAYHLHSFSAQTIRSSKQNWVGPLLAKGVTATMGCVYEPYLEFTPNIAIFFHRLIPLGFSFGEAAYACQAYLSWQTTVVGDPLYRPFWRSPQKEHEDVLGPNKKSLEWWHLKVINSNLAANMPVAELIQYLEQLPETQESAVLLEKLGDLYFAKVRFADAIAAFKKAVARSSSRQERIRLMLSIGRTQELSGDAEGAYANYQEFVRTFPDYPELLSIYRKLQPLAEQLKKTEEKEQFQKEIERLSSAVPGKS